MGKEDYGFTIKIPCDTKKQLLLNQRVARIVFNSKMIDKDYFLYFLLSRKFLDRLYKTAKGTKQANLSTNTIAKFPIIIPPKEEQEQIAVLFLHLETKIDFHLKRKRSLEALFKSMLHHLMTGQIRVKNLQLV
jgi:type I restriction enzyme S subunit